MNEIILLYQNKSTAAPLRIRLDLTSESWTWVKSLESILHTVTVKDA